MSFDHWCTPKPILEALGPIDTDPCWNPLSFVESSVTYAGPECQLRDPGHAGVCACCAGLANGSNGLHEPWFARTYVNPPYSFPSPWASRWASHVRQGFPGAWLSESTGGTAWASWILDSAQVVYLFRQRIRFWDPFKGAFGMSPRAGHMLALANWELADSSFFNEVAIRLVK